MFRINKRKAQSMTEFAMVMALVIGAIAAMQVFVGRAVKEKVSGGLQVFAPTFGAPVPQNPQGTATAGTSQIQERQDYGALMQAQRTGTSNVTTTTQKY